MFIVPLDWSMDNTSKQGLMHEHVGKRAKRVHRSKESQTGGTKQAWQATLHRVEKGYASSKPASQGCISQLVTSKQSTKGTDATTHANGLRDRQAQAYGGHKAWQSLDLDRQKLR